MDGNTVTDFVHPLRASHASPSLREGEDTPPTTNLRQTPFNSPLATSWARPGRSNLPFE